MVQNDKKFCPSRSIPHEPYIIWLSFMLHMCKMMISPGVFFFPILKFWFSVLSGDEREKNGPKWQKLLSVPPYFSRTIYHMIFSYDTHVCMAYMLYVCMYVWYIWFSWSSFVVFSAAIILFCSISLSLASLSNLLWMSANFSLIFSWVTHLYISLFSSIRLSGHPLRTVFQEHHTSCDHYFWYTCVKWWYLQEFFFFF